MKTRREFLQTTGIISSGLLLNWDAMAAEGFESRRPKPADRKFTSQAVEDLILKMKKKIANPELGWLVENFFPNSLGTSGEFEMAFGKPGTFVIPGDIDAMWLRD